MAFLSDATNLILGKPLATGLNSNPFTFESKGGRKKTRSKPKRRKSRKTRRCLKLR